jgi:hypothetical protein
MEKSYAGTTTREIAARDRVPKRDLSTVFEDKQAILVACICALLCAGTMPGLLLRSEEPPRSP